MKLKLLLSMSMMLVLAASSTSITGIAAADEPQGNQKQFESYEDQKQFGPYEWEVPFKYHSYPGPFRPYEKDIITVACAQITPVYGDKDATFEKMKKYIVEAGEKGADLLLFPETVLNNCGRIPSCDVDELSEPFPGPVSDEIGKMAKQYNMYVVYGFVEKNPDPTLRPTNSSAIIGPDGSPIDVYRKVHLEYISNLERGRRPVAFNTPWGPIGVATCYDNYQYPELARTYTLMGSRLLLNVTAAMEFKGFAEQYLYTLKTRAMENWMFVASCNRVGPRAYGPPDFGQSVILGLGKMNYTPVYLAGPASRTEEELIIATFNLKMSHGWRALARQFEENENQGEPDFQPQMWAEVWGTLAQPPISEEMEAANQELASLRSENERLSQKASTSGQTATIAGIAAGIFLLIGLGVMVFRRRK